MGSCLSAIRLVRLHPELHAQAALPLARRTVTLLGWLGVVAALTIIVVGLNADWRPYALVGAWGLVGLAYGYAARRPARTAA